MGFGFPASRPPTPTPIPLPEVLLKVSSTSFIVLETTSTACCPLKLGFFPTPPPLEYQFMEAQQGRPFCSCGWGGSGTSSFQKTDFTLWLCRVVHGSRWRKILR